MNPLSVQAAAEPRALRTVRSCNVPDDTCAWPFSTTGDMTTRPATLVSVIVVPTTGCTTISVREQAPAVASQVLARMPMLTDALLLTSPPASATVKSRTTGDPGSAAGAVYEYVPGVAPGVRVPELGALTSNVDGSMSPFTSVQLSFRLIGIDC